MTEIKIKEMESDMQILLEDNAMLYSIVRSFALTDCANKELKDFVSFRDKMLETTSLTIH